MLGLQYFEFSDLWSPVNMVITVIVALLYLAMIGPYRSKFVDSEPVSIKRIASFLTGVFVFYMANGGPVELLGHLMFSAHMTSMSLAYLVAPPLILLGIPGWMIRPLFKIVGFKRVLMALTHPLIAVMAFNVLFSFYHMPAIHDYVMTHFVVHTLFYVALAITAFMMWWPIITPLPELYSMSELKKMAYIFANGVLITPACALIIFADTAIFATYSDPAAWATAMGYCVPMNAQLLLQNFDGGPEFFQLLDAQEDQQLGGVIMKVLQELTYGAALAYVFFSWYGREKLDDNELEPEPAI